MMIAGRGRGGGGLGRREYLKLKYERKVRRMGVRRERWEEQGEEVRGV